MNALDPHATTRLRIADAAEQLFRQIGYQKTSVADIAKACGMSPANVYRFFASKSAINQAIAHRILDTLGSELEAIAAGPGDAASRLVATSRHMHARHIELFFTEKRLHDMVTAAMSEHWDVIQICIDRTLAVWAGLLREGVAAGQFGAIDPVASAVTFKNCLMLWHHPVLIADALDHGDTVEQLAVWQTEALQLVLRGLGKE